MHLGILKSRVILDKMSVNYLLNDMLNSIKCSIFYSQHRFFFISVAIESPVGGGGKVFREVWRTRRKGSRDHQNRVGGEEK